MFQRRFSKRRSARNFGDRCYWKYTSYQQSELQTLQPQCKNPSDHSIQDYFKRMQAILSVYFHPHLLGWMDGLPSLPSEQSQQLLKNYPEHTVSTEYKSLQFNSIMIDDLTFKILNEVVQIQNTISYTFINNQFSDSNLISVIDLIHNNNNLCQLIFNYNKNKIIRLLQIGNFKNLVSLSLKANGITDKCIRSLVQNLTTSTSRLRYLDLHDNKITKQGVISLNKIFQITNLQFIGLGKNQFRGLKDVQLFLSSVQLIELTETQKQNHLKLLADKKLLDEMVAKKKKPLKRLLDLKMPVDIIEQKNIYYKIKKPYFQIISLIDNDFKQSPEEMKAILRNIYSKFQIILSLNNYPTATKEAFSNYTNITF